MIPRPAKTANESLAVAWHNYPVQTPKTSYTIITMTTAQALKKIEKLERELAAVKAEVLASVPTGDAEGEYTDLFVTSIKKGLADMAAGRIVSEDAVLKDLQTA